MQECFETDDFFSLQKEFLIFLRIFLNNDRKINKNKNIVVKWLSKMTETIFVSNSCECEKSSDRDDTILKAKIQYVCVCVCESGQKKLLRKLAEKKITFLFSNIQHEKNNFINTIISIVFLFPHSLETHLNMCIFVMINRTSSFVNFNKSVLKNSGGFFKKKANINPCDCLYTFVCMCV